MNSTFKAHTWELQLCVTSQQQQFPVVSKQLWSSVPRNGQRICKLLKQQFRNFSMGLGQLPVWGVLDWQHWCKSCRVVIWCHLQRPFFAFLLRLGNLVTCLWEIWPDFELVYEFLWIKRNVGFWYPIMEEYLWHQIWCCLCAPNACSWVSFFMYYLRTHCSCMESQPAFELMCAIKPCGYYAFLSFMKYETLINATVICHGMNVLKWHSFSLIILYS